ncbi:PsiF family protein [Erwinia oleae]|uniref:PsiF family protein n=1 Tax=Erwinia oleae TaxID=796334 RepID=UPI000551D0AB|nr:PsiF family protein [Erwinia oleae]
MKAICFIAGLAAIVSSYVTAAEPGVQQQKMTQCNHQAGEKSLKGDDRKTFMQGCLKKEGSNMEKMTPQQIRMKTCNAQAGEKSLKGADRKTFMSTCLKKS